MALSIMLIPRHPDSNRSVTRLMDLFGVFGLTSNIAVQPSIGAQQYSVANHALDCRNFGNTNES